MCQWIVGMSLVLACNGDQGQDRKKKKIKKNILSWNTLLNIIIMNENKLVYSFSQVIQSLSMGHVSNKTVQLFNNLDIKICIGNNRYHTINEM